MFLELLNRYLSITLLDFITRIAKQLLHHYHITISIMNGSTFFIFFILLICFYFNFILFIHLFFYLFFFGGAQVEGAEVDIQRPALFMNCND